MNDAIYVVKILDALGPEYLPYGKKADPALASRVYMSLTGLSINVANSWVREHFPRYFDIEQDIKVMDSKVMSGDKYDSRRI